MRIDKLGILGSDLSHGDPITKHPTTSTSPTIKGPTYLPNKTNNPLNIKLCG